jgi:hypothetical protein
MASDYPRCEFPEFRTKRDSRFLLNHTDLKRLQQKKPLSATSLSTMS